MSIDVVTKEDAASSIIDDYFLLREMLFKLEKKQLRGMSSENIDTVAVLLVPEMVRRVNEHPYSQ